MIFIDDKITSVDAILKGKVATTDHHIELIEKVKSRLNDVRKAQKLVKITIEEEQLVFSDLNDT